MKVFILILALILTGCNEFERAAPIAATPGGGGNEGKVPGISDLEISYMILYKGCTEVQEGIYGDWEFKFDPERDGIFLVDRVFGLEDCDEESLMWEVRTHYQLSKIIDPKIVTYLATLESAEVEFTYAATWDDFKLNEACGLTWDNAITDVSGADCTDLPIWSLGQKFLEVGESYHFKMISSENPESFFVAISNDTTGMSIVAEREAVFGE